MGPEWSCVARTISLGCCMHEDCRPLHGNHVSAVGYKPCKTKVQPLLGSHLCTSITTVNKNGVQRISPPTPTKKIISGICISHTAYATLTFCTFCTMSSRNELTKIKQIPSANKICSTHSSSTCILLIS